MLSNSRLVSVTLKLRAEYYPGGISPDEYDIYRTLDPQGNVLDEAIIPAGADLCELCMGHGCEECGYDGYHLYGSYQEGI